MKKRKKKMLVFTMLFSLLCTNLLNEPIAKAAAKGYVKSLKVFSKRVSLKTGQSKKITYKVMTKKTASKKIVVKVKNPKVVKVAIKRNKIVIKGKKAGTTKLIVITKGKNIKGKKIKASLNVFVEKKSNTLTASQKPSDRPTAKPQDTIMPSQIPTAKPQATVMPTVSPSESPSMGTTNPDITPVPSLVPDMILETETFDDFSKAASELIKDNRTVVGESIAEDDAYFARRLIIKSDGTNLDFSKIKAKAVIKGVDNIYFVQFSTSSDAKMAMSEISNWSNIVYVEPDSYSGDASNGEPDNSEDSFLSWGVTKIGADKFAKSLASKSTTEIKVAVVDTGVSKHSFLGNRRTDDGYDFYDNDSDPSDPKGHGTHVSGTIVDCTPGLNVKIMPVRVLGLNGGYSSTVGMGIRYAADHGAKVINLSLGGKHSNFKDDNIKYAVSKGVTVVVSAGNEYGSIDSLYYCPAHIPEAICVGAIDSYENKANFSNIGSALDVVAPGVGIVSCVPGGSYESWDGTSMAAPHVSALAAMVMLENPFYTPAQIEQTIKNNCKDLGTFGRDNIYGCGVPDFSKYAAVIPSSISLNKTSATIETGKTVSLTATITPSNATDKTVTWSSSNTSIATVSGGIVTGKSVGNATITVKTNNGKTATCIVTVKNSIVEVTGITLNSANISLEAGETTTLIASITPSNATDQTITWSSSNTSVATVSNGIVTGKSTGTATIMATTQNGKSATCQVTVIDESVIKINNATELMAISNKLDGNYILVKDIDISGYNWKPIGTKNNPFRGTFDGAGYKITGLTIKNIGEGYQGLFGYNKGILKNVNVSGSIAILGSLQTVYIGGICAYSEGGLIDSSVNSVNIDVDINNTNAGTVVYAGGIVGVADMYCIVSDCANQAKVEASAIGNGRTSSYAGGISGITASATPIKKCINNGNINAYAMMNSTKYFLTSYAGGITGDDTLGTVEECVNSGSIKAEGYPAGKTEYNCVVGAGGIMGHIGSGIGTGNTNESSNIEAIGNEYVTVIRKGDIYGY